MDVVVVVCVVHVDDVIVDVVVDVVVVNDVVVVVDV